MQIFLPHQAHNHRKYTHRNSHCIKPFHERIYPERDINCIFTVANENGYEKYNAIES